MSVNISPAPAPTRPLRLKRLELDDPQDYTEALKCKRPRLSLPPSSPGLAPCLRPLRHSPGPVGSDHHCVSCIGPYLLLEPTEGTETYRAIHRVTEQEYTCKVCIVAT